MSDIYEDHKDEDGRCMPASRCPLVFVLVDLGGMALHMLWYLRLGHAIANVQASCTSHTAARTPSGPTTEHAAGLAKGQASRQGKTLSGSLLEQIALACQQQSSHAIIDVQ
jgi:hypothetical protein